MEDMEGMGIAAKIQDYRTYFKNMVLKIQNIW